MKLNVEFYLLSKIVTSKIQLTSFSLFPSHSVNWELTSGDIQTVANSGRVTTEAKLTGNIFFVKKIVSHSDHDSALARL